MSGLLPAQIDDGSIGNSQTRGLYDNLRIRVRQKFFHDTHNHATTALAKQNSIDLTGETFIQEDEWVVLAG